MANPNVLSTGSLDDILERKMDHLTPLVQILGTKMMSSNRIRAVISDGDSLCQHCIFVNEDVEKMYNDGKLCKFSVVRLEEYSTSMLPKKENMPVILVNKVTVIKQGEEINRKLTPGESFQEAAATTAASALASSNNGNRPAHAAVQRPIAAGTNTLKSENVCPINVLTPFFNAWVLRVRVTNKTPLKTYSNQRGEGKLFSFDCCDESGEIRITAFNTEVDKFYDLIERDRVYLISRGSIKSANKKFSNLNNDYEITLNQNSVIEVVQSGGQIELPKLRFKFVNLADLTNIEASTTVDVIGVMRSITEPETLVSRKTQKELIKREFALVDKSLAEVRVTLWNDVATSFTGEVGQVIALKGAIVGDFKGKTLSTVQSTIIQVEPDIAETAVIRQWFNTQGSNSTFTSLNRQDGGSAVDNSQRFACQITPKLISANPGGQTYSGFNGMIAATNRSSNHLYKACGNNGCMKKVTEEDDGLYHCTKCARSSPTFEWRLMLSVNVADATGSIWVTLFQENAEKLLGRTAQELAQLYEMDQAEYAKAVGEVRFKSFYFRVGSRLDEYNNEQRVRTSAYKIVPHKPVDRSRRLMAMIDVLAKQVSA